MICLTHDLHVLDECELRSKNKRMKPGEYQTSLRRDSWKLNLIQVINETLEYTIDRESFIENMEVEGYSMAPRNCADWATLCSDAAFGNLPWQRISNSSWGTSVRET